MKNKIAYIDAHGTLIGNPAVTWNAAIAAIQSAIQAGWQIVIASSDQGCEHTSWGQTLGALGVGFADKESALTGAGDGATVIDDNRHILRCVTRAGGRAIHASELACPWWED